MRIALLTACLLVLSSIAYSQSQTPPVDDRWRLTTSDSIVHGPYRDLVRMWANRSIERDLRREAARAVVARGRLADGLQAEVDLLRTALEARGREVEDMRDLIGAAQARELECRVSMERQRTWGAIGRGAVVVCVGVGVAAILLAR